MTARTPLISICVPNLNKRRFLEERMETLLAQTFTDWEMIVCDSYSDDGSWEFLQKFKNDPRIRLHQVPRAGLYAGWNECLQRARGTYINIATSDDTAVPTLLEKLVEPLERRPQLQIAACDYGEIDDCSRPLPERTIDYRQFLGNWLTTPSVRSGQTEFLLGVAFITCWQTMASVLFRRSLLEKTGMFPTDLGSSGDIEWSLRASLASDVAWVPGKLTGFRIYAAQATARSVTWTHWKTYYKSLSRLVDEPGLIPDQWRKEPDWREKLLSFRRRAYFNFFDCYRWVLRADPNRFFAGARRALRAEPLWLVRHALKGFPCPQDSAIDSQTAARNLIEHFGAEWPPQKVDKW